MSCQPGCSNEVSTAIDPQVRSVVLRYVRQAIGNVEKTLYARGILSAHHLALPDFLGIGAQKSGTTWLFQNLRVHPQLFLPQEKELHYFDWRFSSSLRSYSRHFSAAAGRIKGEITPNYCALPEQRIAFLRTIVPDLRIIFLMRNPIDRAWSQALMNLVENRGRPLADVSEEEFLAHFRDDRSVRRGDYLANLDRWERHFPREQIFCEFFESIQTRPRDLLGEIFRFLGASQDVDWQQFPCGQVVRPGPRAPIPARLRQFLEAYYRQDIQRLYDRFGEPVALWWK